MITNTPAEKKKDEGPNRAQKRRTKVRSAYSLTMRRVALQKDREKEARRVAVLRKQEAAHVRAVLRKANKVPVITNAQRKAEAERQRLIEEKKRRHAKYARKLARKATA